MSAFELGGTVTIPRLGFGAMQLPGRMDGPGADHATAVAVARRAVELGARHIDTTAAFYSSGTGRANDILREALHPYSAGLTIATKVGPLTCALAAQPAKRRAWSTSSGRRRTRPPDPGRGRCRGPVQRAGIASRP